MSAIYGYIRVSSKEQNTGRQLDALRGRGVPDANLFTDRQSGKDFNRPQYKRMLRKLKAGDLLVIKSIDRLGRNYEDIMDHWRFITKERGVDIEVLDMPVLNTRSRDGDITGRVISDIVLELLSFVAQKEREFIRQRQSEGIAAAKRRGVKFGRPPKKRPRDFVSVASEYRENKISASQAAAQLGVSRNTFKSWYDKK
ncbi:MAG: recombinase family protein [Clostridium sp.]|jgi:DNA invertase Pin-like site-specific DNA recombinase|nr:recombinase family protein [Clostridium sp.]